jgi:hypothetical protein
MSAKIVDCCGLERSYIEMSSVSVSLAIGKAYILPTGGIKYIIIFIVNY